MKRGQTRAQPSRRPHATPGAMQTHPLADHPPRSSGRGRKLARPSSTSSPSSRRTLTRAALPRRESVAATLPGLALSGRRDDKPTSPAAPAPPPSVPHQKQGASRAKLAGSRTPLDLGGISRVRRVIPVFEFLITVERITPCLTSSLKVVKQWFLGRESPQVCPNDRIVRCNSTESSPARARPQDVRQPHAMCRRFPAFPTVCERTRRRVQVTARCKDMCLQRPSAQHSTYCTALCCACCSRTSHTRPFADPCRG